MENAIDRASYRRDNINIQRSKKEHRSLMNRFGKMFVKQTIIGALILSSVGILKILNVGVALDWIKAELSKNISISTIYNIGEIKFKKMFNTKIHTVANNSNVNAQLIDGTGDIEDLEPTSFINTTESTEPEYETAVEGINQLSIDADYIKANYKLIYPISGTVTSIFGVRNSSNPIITSYHSGIDLAANTGTKIKSALAGEVTKVSDEGAYGKHLTIKTDNIVILYAHCSKINVKQGQKVKQGDVIAEVGSTGLSTGSHLHFEIKLDDRLVNPADILNF